MTRDEKTKTPAQSDERGMGKDQGSYLRFGAMIITAMTVMYAETYMNTFELSHVRWSETRVFMTLIMGALMTVIMLGFMLGMYRNRRANVGILLAVIALFSLATWLVRSQATVQETSYMRAMVPHTPSPS